MAQVVREPHEAPLTSRRYRRWLHGANIFSSGARLGARSVWPEARDRDVTTDKRNRLDRAGDDLEVGSLGSTAQNKTPGSQACEMSATSSGHQNEQTRPGFSWAGRSYLELALQMVGMLLRRRRVRRVDPGTRDG